MKLLPKNVLDSYRRWTGVDLLERVSLEADITAMWNCPQVVVAHGVQADPAFVFCNYNALELWEMHLEEFLGMPSRLTAEPVHRDERQRLLEQTRIHGYVDNYCGIRISKSGKRFTIENAILWMVLNDQEEVIGQAAVFEHWRYL
jgi:MEKHLA domain